MKLIKRFTFKEGQNFNYLISVFVNVLFRYKEIDIHIYKLGRNRKKEVSLTEETEKLLKEKLEIKI